jgi:hypothetical protein
MADPVFLIDDLTAQPGRGEALLDAYLREYVPGAEARGMTLLHRLVEPAFWLRDRSNRLLFIWTVPTPSDVWAGKRAARGDEAVLAWWNERAAPMILTRRRSMLADAGALEELDRV